jgi:hypothetical protein
MIARVRIAPVEQWCDWHKVKIYKIAPGNEISIDTASCAVDPPGLDLRGHEPGKRWWLVGEEDIRRYGSTPRHRWICESMLEMD